MWRCTYCTTHVADEKGKCPQCGRERPGPDDAPGADESRRGPFRWLPTSFGRGEVSTDDPYDFRTAFAIGIALAIGVALYHNLVDARGTAELVQGIFLALLFGGVLGLGVGVALAFFWFVAKMMLHDLLRPATPPTMVFEIEELDEEDEDEFEDTEVPLDQLSPRDEAEEDEALAEPPSRPTPAARKHLIRRDPFEFGLAFWWPMVLTVVFVTYRMMATDEGKTRGTEALGLGLFVGILAGTFVGGATAYFWARWNQAAIEEAPEAKQVSDEVASPWGPTGPHPEGQDGRIQTTQGPGPDSPTSSIERKS